MAKDLISICIPCHNSAAYVGATIESVLAQSWPHLEIIVVVDASTDQSAAVVQRYQSPRLKLLLSRAGNAAKSRNLALTAAQGDWIKFLDADDLLHPETLAAQLHRLEAGRHAVASAQWGRFYGLDLGSFHLNPESVWRDMAADQWLVEAWRRAEPMMQPGLFLIPRSLLEKAGGWDETLSLIDDFEFFARLLCHAEEVRFTPEATLHYRSGIPGSLSSRKTRAAAESAFHSLLKGTGHLLARRCDAEARLSCANIMQNFIYTFYPEHPDLRAAMTDHVAELGGSDLPPPGSPWFQRTRRLIGWKAARHLQRAAGRF